MRVSVLIVLILFSCNLVRAQQAPEKYADLLSRYKDYFVNNDVRDEKDKDGHDGPEALFNRWAWYWQQHLDANGYLVSPAKTRDEWLRYTQSTRSAARTTILPSDWVFQGPFQSYYGSSLGRINVVAFDPVDSNTLYVGSAAGSTWKTTDGGATWAPLYDNLPSLGVADIKINPLNRNTIYVLTGDGDAWDSYSAGIIVSHDAGATWNTTGITWVPSYSTRGLCLLLNPSDTNSLMLASSAGIFKSFDAGATWYNTSVQSFKQIVYNPFDTNVVYGTTYTNGNIVQSNDAQIMRSPDGGLTWDTVTAFTNAQRINLAVCPANPAIVKAVVSDPASGLKGIYGSTDTGRTFTALFLNDSSACLDNLLSWDYSLPSTQCGGQGWYDLSIAMNPSNPMLVTVAGINDYYSTDGGLTWNPLELFHADKHFLAYHPLTGALFETCDGGILKNYEPTDGWTDLTTGVYITEFYRCAVDNGVPFCLGGAQDNGSMMLNGSTYTYLTGGDGCQPLINYGDPYHILYTSYEYGNVMISRDGGASFQNITDALLPAVGAGITPYVLHPYDTGTLVLALHQVFASYDNGNSWSPISPVFNSSDYISMLAISQINPDYIFAAYIDYLTTDNSIIKYTTDFGATWNTVTTPTGEYISSITADPSNANVFWVTQSGYLAGTKVLSYNINSHHWTNVSDGLPNYPVNCLVFDTFSKAMYIGTDAGVFYKDTTMTDWTLFNNHLPLATIYDLHINYTTGEIWAATFGRGMWKSGKADLPNSVNTVSTNANNLVIAPNPSHGTFTVRITRTQFLNQQVTVRLISAQGTVVYQSNTTTGISGKIEVNAPGLPPGFYTCEIRNDEWVQRGKLVLE